MYTPVTSWLIKQCANIEKGSGKKGEIVGHMSFKHVYEIAQIKKHDPQMAHRPLLEICKLVCSHARNMGVEVLGKGN